MAKSKPSKIKMDGEERKLSIVKAATSIFAQKGFHGATIKNIATAAGVSEALLYMHFSSKEEIYLSLGKYHEGQILTLIQSFKDREPGGKMLIELVYCLVMIILTDIHGKTDFQRAFERLFAYSLLENTDFTKHVFIIYEQEFSPLWEKGIQAAKKNNELKKNTDTRNSIWFVHNLAMAVNFLSFSGKKLFPYKGSFEDLVQGIVRFSLTGIGLTDEVIGRYYKPAILKRLLKDIFS